MNKILIALMGLFFILIVGCNSTGGTKAEPQGKALSTAEIEKLFSEKTSDWEKKKNGMKMKIFTSRSGEQIVSYVTGKKAGEKRIIRWTAENNMHCGHRNGRKFCGEIILVGNEVYHKVREGKVRNIITSFVDGNQIK